MGIFSKNPRISFPVNMSPKVSYSFFISTIKTPQNCDNCAKLKSQLKLIQDGNGKHLVDVNILKPIKVS